MIEQYLQLSLFVSEFAALIRELLEQLRLATESGSLWLLHWRLGSEVLLSSKATGVVPEPTKCGRLVVHGSIKRKLFPIFRVNVYHTFSTTFHGCHKLLNILSLVSIY